MSVPVVTIAKGGFLDTVLNEKTGLLYGHTDDFAKDIIMLLKNDKLNEQYGRDGVQLCKKFTPDKIIKEWNRLFLKVLNDEKMEYICGSVADYVEQNPDLRTQPTEDMWDFKDEEEDQDDSWDEEEDDWGEEEDYEDEEDY